MERRPKHKSHSTPKDPYGRLTEISIYNRQTSLPIDRKSIKRAVKFFLESMSIENRAVSVYLVTKQKITTLHGEFFDDPTPTDCISFPLDPPFLGEIFVCPEVAQDYSPKTPYDETTLYIFHSLLHLLGYDDIDKNDRAQMRREERRLMALARKHQCILEPSSSRS